MINRKNIISLIITLLILLAGAISFQVLKSNKKSTISSGPVKKEIKYVKVNSYPTQSVQNEIEIDGRLNAFEKITVSAEVTGRLLEIPKSFRQGSYFKKGDLLFEIDNKDEKYNLFALRSRLLNALTQMMPDLKFDYPESFEKWKNYLDQLDPESNIKPLPVVSDQREKYYVAGKDIFNQYYSIKSLEDRMQNYRIHAPFSGVFLNLNSYPGALVSPGVQLASIMNTNRFELISPIPVEELQFLTVGQEVELNSDEMNKSWKGKVNRIGTQIDQNTQNIPVYISVYGIGLKDGMYLKGKIKTKTIDNVSIIPNDAIVDENKVFLVEDTLAILKPVVIINTFEENILVKGIGNTDKIIIEDTDRIYNGQTVQILN
ncbi:MAG: HlyD family efflux transporter periplasmic adaptor subunit [Saprospiraceae bacterium]|nr:HlyD family efflux transporter periplasmic adaptor subunit [Bacteroidia bacterium]MBT8228752.1 HlyD family efflux transporter periplasmic adaptor subunit [Bacteroidia bacterium]NNF22619.1 HlyD family efflux transporter periplasmic adaptor subunit [Saprospiraceae bacterium]